MSLIEEADGVTGCSAPSTPVLPCSPWIVRDEIRIALLRADEIEAGAARRAAEMVSRARADADAIREAARQEGMREGAAAAARLIAETDAAVATYRRTSESELVPLAFAIAHRILGTFPEDDRLLRAVTTALDEHQGTSGLRLRADPHTASRLRDALRRADRTDQVLVDVDDAASPGSCVLMHPRGRASVGPIDQLHALFGAAVASSPSNAS